MPRPRMRRKICFKPKTIYFKPQGIPISELVEIILTGEEAEALKLKDYNELDQTEAAEKMNTSQSTFQRILSSGRKKISQAIIEGKALRIDK